MKSRFKWRHQYETERDEQEGDNAALYCEDESLTQQHFAEDANLNVIAKRFGLDTIPMGPIDPSAFRDTTEDPDLATILQHKIDAKNHFMALPTKLRRRFHDSPDELWAFVNDPDNHEEAVRLGLLHRATQSTADGVPPATTTDSGGASATQTTAQPTAPANPPESPRP